MKLIKSGAEAWKNATPAMIYVLKYNRRGDLASERVEPGQILNIYEDERKINQEMASSRNKDFFSNGTLVPIRMIEDAEDLEEIRSNANLMTDEQMETILKQKQWKKFDAALAEVTNPLVLRRMLEIARSEEIDATHRQLTTIETRLQELIAEDQIVTVVEREVVKAPTEKVISASPRSTF